MKYFETIKCIDKKALYLDYHLKRVFNTIGKKLDFDSFINPPDNKLYRCKVIYTKDGIEDINYFEYKKKDINSCKIVHKDDLQYNYKYLDRSSINSLLDKNFDEIIIVKDDLVTDTSIANIAVYYENKWLTPKRPLLYGTTRQRYIDNGILKEADITVDMIQNSKQIAFLNAMIDFDIIKHRIRFDI